LNKKVHLIEKFLTYQGEIFSGRRSLILRYKTCNRIDNNCGCYFCDTKDKLNSLDIFECSLYEIQDIINKSKCDIILTGGEPTYKKNLEETIDIISNIKNCKFMIESNGLNIRDVIHYDNVYFVFSPKFFNQKEIQDNFNKVVEFKYWDNLYLKIVFRNSPLVLKFLELISEELPPKQIYLMPEGKTKEEILQNSKETIRIADKFNFNLSTRMHIMHDFV